MSRIETNIVIHRPVNEVWNIFAQPEKMPIWGFGLKEVERITEGPIGVGSRFSAVICFLGREERETQEIIAFEPYKRVAFRVIEAGDEVIDYAFEPVRNSTNVIVHITFTRDPSDPVPEPLFMSVLRRQVQGGLENLKDFVEIGALVPA